MFTGIQLPVSNRFLLSPLQVKSLYIQMQIKHKPKPPVNVFLECLNSKCSFTENVCPLMTVSNAIVNTSACLADGFCQSGTVLEYSCNGDYTITTPVTVCLANTSWSHRPTCLKRKGGMLK